MDEKKRQRYLAISKQLAELVGGRKNIQGIAHCATRLRIVLENNDVVDQAAIENLDLVKGVFVAGDQLQIIFGAGLVNDVYEVFKEYTGIAGMSLSDLKTEANKKMNPIQRIIKALSDVFIDIMPGILAAALLTGLSGVLTNLDVVQNNETLWRKAYTGHCDWLYYALTKPDRCLCSGTGNRRSDHLTYLWSWRGFGRFSGWHYRCTFDGSCDSKV